MSTETILLLFTLGEVLYFGARFSKEAGYKDYALIMFGSMCATIASSVGIAMRLSEQL